MVHVIDRTSNRYARNDSAPWELNALRRVPLSFCCAKLGRVEASDRILNLGNCPRGGQSLVSVRCAKLGRVEASDRILNLGNCPRGGQSLVSVRCAKLGRVEASERKVGGTMCPPLYARQDSNL